MTDKTITEDIILNATLYIPIQKKSALARTFAEDCKPFFKNNYVFISVQSFSMLKCMSIHNYV